MGIANWKKIDFHTHTPASRCFNSRSAVTPEQWLEAVKNSGLDAVVVTDHNSVEWVSKLRTALGERTDIFIYPGVELCVGTSYTHILVIFDPNMTIDEIEGFVIQCGLPKNIWNDTTKFVKEATLASLVNEYKNKVLIIPAHFNGQKGICRTLGLNGTSGFYKSIPFNAVEVRNEDDLNEVKNKVANNAFPAMAMITGSDNPGNRPGEHDIINFGNAYTWVKISEYSLEALRQVFLDYETRSYCVLSDGNKSKDMNGIEHNYIAGMKINGLKHVDSLEFRFSPNLNCIIGGRGTGKSTIIEMLRLAFKKYDEKKTASIINNTYQDKSNLEVFYNFGIDSQYSVHVNGNKNNKQWQIEDKNGITNEYPQFPISIYSQKELYNIVEDESKFDKNESSPLLRIIDDSISYEKALVTEKIVTIKKELMSFCEELNVVRSKVQEIPILKADIELNESKLTMLKGTGIIDKRKEILSLRETYNKLKELTKDNLNMINDIEKIYNDKISNLYKRYNQEESMIDQDNGKFIKGIVEINENLIKSILKSKHELNDYINKLDNSELKMKIDKKQNEYNTLLENLEGLNIDNLKLIENDLNEKKIKLLHLQQVELEVNEYIEKINLTIPLYFKAHNQLTELRRNIINEINQSGNNIQLKIASLSSSEKWIYHLRNELGKSNAFDSDFDKLKKKIFKNNIIKQDELLKWVEFLLITQDGNIKNYINSNLDPRFEKIWLEKKKDNVLHTLLNFMPEDKVELKILNKGNKISINEGSPGQKSAAILAFILNQGKNPLIIDQPEDDLDNSLIINLVVESIRNIKNSRQIIIVTHNPNIPVLGDAEGIIMLDRNSKGKVVFKDGKKTGCIEEKLIKEGICNIMEGGIDSFKLRENKYKYMLKSK